MSATPDPDLPGGGGGTQCVASEMHGHYVDIHECRAGNGLFYRLILGDNIEFDIHPDRILLRHGQARVEVRADKIITQAPLLEHHGDLHVKGDVTAEGNITDHVLP